jgi:hypothetical protein
MIPVLLLCVKYVLDLQTMHHANVYRGGTIIHKKCAKDAAYEVAKVWNPGLTLNQQKESLLRVADTVYNKNPIYRKDSIVDNAIPGLEPRVAHKRDLDENLFWPTFLDWDPKDDQSTSLKVEYDTVTDSQNFRGFYIYGGHQAFNRIMYGVDKDPSFLLKEEKKDDNSSVWVSEDLFWNALPGSGVWMCRGISLTTRKEYKDKGGLYAAFYYPTTNYYSTETATYTKRHKANDDKVQISLENDKIKVQTD